MQYALVNSNDVVDRYSDDTKIRPDVQTKPGWRWLPVELSGQNADYDPAIQLLEGPIVTVEATRVLHTFTVRAKTAVEIDNDKSVKINTITDVLLRALFNHENRIRTLEARPTISAVQFREHLKSLL